MQLAYQTVTLPLESPFRISRSTDVEVEVVWIELSAGRVSGFGEATPQDHYGESVASATRFLDGAGDLLGEDPFAFEEIEARLAEVPGEMAAKAAIDAALHDLCGKLCGQPFWRVLGLRREARRRRSRSGSATWTTWPGARSTRSAGVASGASS